MTRRTFIRESAASALMAMTGGCIIAGHGEDEITAAMRRYVDEKLYGGLACASNYGFEHYYGYRKFTEPKLPVTAHTLFDLASVGKTQTAAMIALLVAQGKIDPDAPFTEYLPEHVLAKENCRITVSDLATHSGGFDNNKPYERARGEEHLRLLLSKRPVWPRGEKYCYACSNFAYLGLIIEQFTGMDLDKSARKLLWGPLGMNDTTWNEIIGNPDAAEEVPLKIGDRVRVIGEHNDFAAFNAPKPMGNGACFSTARDMLKFVTDFIGHRTFPKEYYDLQFAVSFDGDNVRRSFGWGMTGKSSWFSDWCPTGFSARAICHSGWTGPVIAVDPECGFSGVVLGNKIADKEHTMGPRMHLLDLMRKGF